MRLVNKFSAEKHSWVNQIKIWILAARPKTLTAGIIPIIVGTVLAWGTLGTIDLVVATQALLCSILIQIGINLTNDALDFQKGADNDKRLGFKRVTHSGLLSPRDVLTGGFFCFALAVLCGIPLIFHAGWPLFLVLIVSIAFGYLYTGGPFPLAYYGLGDVFAFIFYGVVCTATGYFVQVGNIGLKPIVAGSQIGFLATAMMAINNLRDIESDSLAGKRTLAVLFGKTFARIEITLLTCAPLITGLHWIQSGYILASLLPFLLCNTMFQNLRAIWMENPSTNYNGYFVRSAQIHLLFGLLLTVGLLL